MRTKLPMFAELMAGSGLDMNARYRMFAIDPDLAGPTPGSWRLRAHDDAYSVSSESENADIGMMGLTSPWLPTSNTLASTEFKTAFTKAAQPLGSESIPRLYWRRLRTEADSGVAIGDEVLVSMPASVENAAPPFAFNTVYTVGNYVRNKELVNADPSIHRVVYPETSGTSELDWGYYHTRQSGGVVFLANSNGQLPTVNNWTTEGNLNPPIIVAPWRVVGFEQYTGCFLVEQSFNPEINGSGGTGWIFNCGVRTMADIGPDDCYFGMSDGISAGILSADGVIPTLAMSEYETQRGGQAWRLYSGAGTVNRWKFHRLSPAALYGRYVVLARVAEHWADVDDLPFDQQEVIFAWRVRDTLSDAMLVPDTEYVRSNVSTLSIGIN